MKVGTRSLVGLRMPRAHEDRLSFLVGSSRLGTAYLLQQDEIRRGIPCCGWRGLQCLTLPLCRYLFVDENRTEPIARRQDAHSQAAAESSPR